MSVKCFLKAAARFLLGSSTACTAGLWGGGRSQFSDTSVVSQLQPRAST